MNDRIRELQDEIEILDDELKVEINKFNENLYNHRIGMTPFKIYYVSLRCEAIPYNPYESSVNFYEKFNGIFEFVPKLKEEHPEYTEEDIHYSFLKYCVQENEQIKNYLMKIGGVIDENYIVDRANMASVVYTTLNNFGFNDIIAKQKLIRKKQEELERLKNIEDSLTEENQENVQENDTVIDKQSSENRTDRFGKVKELLNSKAKKLIKKITGK